MADPFVQSLKLEENVFELEEDTMVSYLIHLAAPYTDADGILVKKGTRFYPTGPMRDDAMYMRETEENRELKDRMIEQLIENDRSLYPRLMGFSFYITEEELKTWKLKFISGSREYVEQAFERIRTRNRGYMGGTTN